MLVFVPTLAYAEDDDNRGFSTAATLGWLAIGCGVAQTLACHIQNDQENASHEDDWRLCYIYRV